VIATDRDAVAATIAVAINQDAAHAHVAHFGEGDLSRAGIPYDSDDRRGLKPAI
jgi:hypothetical protein